MTFPYLIHSQAMTALWILSQKQEPSQIMILAILILHGVFFIGGIAWLGFLIFKDFRRG